MTKQLDELLCAKYPEIFRDRHAPINQTCMCWGFECGDGWYPLIDALCAQLMAPVVRARREYQDRTETAARLLEGDVDVSDWLHDYASDEQITKAKAEIELLESQIPVAVQVKEKFGTLRFYITGGTDEQWNLIQFAEAFSGRVCEDCATMKDVRLYTDGWHRTLCVVCAADEGREKNPNSGL